MRIAIWPDGAVSHELGSDKLMQFSGRSDKRFVQGEALSQKQPLDAGCVAVLATNSLVSSKPHRSEPMAPIKGPCLPPSAQLQDQVEADDDEAMLSAH